MNTLPHLRDHHWMRFTSNGDHWESLLRRPPIVADTDARNAASAGRVVLITGAGGCIGSALAKAIAASDPRLLILLDHSEQNLFETQSALAADAPRAICLPILGNVGDRALLKDLFSTHRPEIIYHAAAFKHVPLVESNPFAAVRNNALGTAILADAAVEHGAASLTLISTDKAVNPHSVMGAAKRLAEMLLLRRSSPNTQMKAVRLGNVLGSHGSVVPIFKDQIARGGPVAVTDPLATRYFLTLEETVEWIFAAATLPGSGIYVPEMGEPVKIVELAKHLIRIVAGDSSSQIPIVFTGLRPGEKLTEELVSSGESFEPTSKENLCRIQPTEISAAELDAAVSEIEESIRERDVAALLAALCRVLPAYRPSETVRGLLEPSHA